MVTRPDVRDAAPDLVAALREFVGYGYCRQNNARERAMLARRFARLAERYLPLLAALDASPFMLPTDGKPPTLEEARGLVRAFKE